MATFNIVIPTGTYADHDDCLAAAAADCAEERGLVLAQVTARWAADRNRDEIVLTVPAAAVATLGTGIDDVAVAAVVARSTYGTASGTVPCDALQIWIDGEACGVIVSDLDDVAGDRPWADYDIHCRIERLPSALQTEVWEWLSGLAADIPAPDGAEQEYDSP